ncbi:MAG: tubulin-like doman-containing protein [Nitrososphaeria archaeon]
MFNLLPFVITLAASTSSPLAVYLLFAETIGLAVVLVTVVLYVLFWLFTDEIMNREELFLIVDLIFTFIWWLFTQPISGALYVMFTTEYKSFSIVVTALLMGLSLVSLLLLVIPILSFLRKYLRFNALTKQLNRIESDYHYLVGTEDKKVKGKYDQIQETINNSKAGIKDIKTKIDTANQLRNIALKNPNIVIKSIADKPVVPKPTTPSVNYLMIGLGGTGSLLLETFIDYLVTQEMINPNATDNPYLFVFFDTSSISISRIKKKYAGTPVEKLIYTFDNFNAFLKDNLIAHNPWLAGMDVSLVDGTGNRRALGLAAYVTVKDTLLKEISARANELKEHTHRTRFLVVMMNSLGGGTGSGSFLSFTRDLETSLKNINIEPYILGFGVLPKSQEGAIFHANAYGAIKELQFTLSKGRAKVLEKASFTNPFLAYFLISFDRVSSTADVEIALALTRLLFDLGTAGYDLNDIGTRAGQAPESFFTFSRYDVYFPASRLSWLDNVAIPLNKEVDASYDRLLKQINEDLFNSINEYTQKVEKLLNEVEILDNNYREFMPNVYKRWSELAKSARDKLAQIRENLSENGPYCPTNLKKQQDSLNSQVAQPEESIVSLNKQVIGPFKSTINAEIEFLKSTPARQIEWVFNVPEPEKFDTDVLTRETTSAYSIIKSLGRTEDFITALSTLKTTVGSIDQTMANVDYNRIYISLNKPTIVKMFIEKYNKTLIKENDVVSPPIKTILMLVTSASENLNVPEFPSEESIKQALLNKTSDPDFKKYPLSMKKYEISSYQIITGLYPYRLKKDDQPLLKDLSYLEKSYLDMKTQTQNMIFHHTLFYNDYAVFDDFIYRITGRRISTLVPSEAIKIVTKFWQDYDPSVEFVDIWGILELADAYNEVSSVKNELENFIEWMNRSLTSLERGSTDVDVSYIKNLFVSGIKIEKFSVIKEIKGTSLYVSGDKIEKINSAIDEILSEATTAYSYVQSVNKMYDEWFSRLNSIKERNKDNTFLIYKVLQPMINELTKLEDRTRDIEQELKHTLDTISM